MIQENKTELYTSPKVEVIEVKAQQVMCTSTNDMPVDDEFNF